MKIKEEKAKQIANKLLNSGDKFELKRVDDWGKEMCFFAYPKKSKPGELISLPIYIMVNDEAVARYATSEERMEILSKQ